MQRWIEVLPKILTQLLELLVGINYFDTFFFCWHFWTHWKFQSDLKQRAQTLWRWHKKITCLWYPFKILLILDFWHDTIWKYLMQICMRFWWFFLVIYQRINKLLTVLWLWHLCRNRLRWARQQRIHWINTEWKDIKFHKSNHTAVTRRNHQNTIIICVCVSWYGDDRYVFIACHRI